MMASIDVMAPVIYFLFQSSLARVTNDCAKKISIKKTLHKRVEIEHLECIRDLSVTFVFL